MSQPLELLRVAILGAMALSACGARSALETASSDRRADGGALVGDSGARSGGGSSRQEGGAGARGGSSGRGRDDAGDAAGSSGAPSGQGGRLDGGVGVNDSGSCGAACSAEERCQLGQCVCPVGSFRRLSVHPRPAAVGVALDEDITATFSCAPDVSVNRPASMRVEAGETGYLPATFPAPPASNVVILRPLAPARRKPFFAGELSTAWLGRELGGPYLWQFVAATSPSSAAFEAGQPVGDANECDVAFGDLDNDGDLDALASASSGPKVWLNDGRGGFTSGAPVDAGFGLCRYGLADLDRDGDLDILGEGRVYFNEGKAEFGAAVELGYAYPYLPTVAGDVDGDGDLDLIAPVDALSPADASPWVRLNDGTGRFTRSKAFPSAGVSVEVNARHPLKLADLDGDGDLDLVIVSLDATRIFLNAGDGTFSGGETLPGDVTRDLALGDIDGDGDVDVVMSDWGRLRPVSVSNHVWRNDGHARFAPAGDAGHDSLEVLLADVDGDGDLDVVATDNPTGPCEPQRPAHVLSNDGSGRFEDTGQPFPPLGADRLVLGDLDGDGDLDAWVNRPELCFHRSTSSVWFNRN